MLPAPSTATRPGSPITALVAVAGVCGGAPPATVEITYCCADALHTRKKKERARIPFKPPFEAVTPVSLSATDPAVTPPDPQRAKCPSSPKSRESHSRAPPQYPAAHRRSARLTAP